MELKPYIIDNRLDIEKYLCYYSDPWKKEEEYNSDSQNKTKVLWDLIRNNTINKIIKKYSIQLRKDIQRKSEETFLAKQLNQELYGEYFHMVQCLKEEIDQTVWLVRENKTDLTIIPEMKEEMNKLIMEIKKLKIQQQEKDKIDFELKQDYKNKITLFESKMEKYEEVTKKLEKYDKTITELSEETEKLKQEAKQETTLLINSRIRQLTKEEENTLNFPITSEYNVFLKIKGFEELDKKLQEIIQLNQTLTLENGKLKIQLNELLIKYKNLFSEKKDQIKKISKEVKTLLQDERKDGKNLIDFYMYVSKKKRKNRAHREKAQKHLKECLICKKQNNNKFFSFTITPVLIELLKEKGYEDYILFNEKECCHEMSKHILKAISYLSCKYNSKSAVWYRNFLIKKFNKENNNKIPSNLKRNNLSAINDRFYYTYLSSAVLKKPIDYNEFIKEPEKIQKYYKYYTQLDKEIKTQTRLYSLNTAQYHLLKKNKEDKIYEQTMAYLNADKKIPVQHNKDDEWNYKKAIARTTNPKLNLKIKKIVENLLKNKDIITMTDHLKRMKNAAQEIPTTISTIKSDIIKIEEDKIKAKELKNIIMREMIEKIEEKRSKIIEDLDSEDNLSSSEEDSENEYYNNSDDD